MTTLRFRESGGIAGQIRGCEIDLDKLPKKIEGALKKLIEAKNKAGAAAGAVRDALQYEIELEIDGKRQRISFDETTIPTSARVLIDYLNAKSSFRMPD